MIKFYLYSNENKKGLLISECRDEMTANFLKSYYRNIYNKDRFLVTMKRPRKKEEFVTGNHILKPAI